MSPVRNTSSKRKRRKNPEVRKPRRQYDEKNMLAAIEDVRRGVPVATAARKNQVPCVTLLYKATGKSPIDRKSSPDTVLTKDEEEILVQWIKKMAKAGFPVSTELLKDSVQHIIKNLKRESPFTNGRPGQSWLQCFQRRHLSISLRVAENLTLSRASVTKDQIKSWFTGTEDYLKKHDLFDILQGPTRVFNGDETAFFLNPSGKKVLAAKGDKTVYQKVNNDEKECLTVLVTASASGHLAPAMVVFRYERMPDTIVNNFPDGWGIGRSENGWMTGRTFYEYFANVFSPWLDSKNIPRPVIFFVDGHTSHLTYHLSEFRIEKKIILIALPPNTTHFMQPMDVSDFHSLKQHWKTKVHEWRVRRVNEPNLVLRKKDFSPLLHECLIHTVTHSMVANGFRKCGLLPWDMNAIPHFSEDDDVSANQRKQLDSKKVLLGLSVLESLFQIWERMRSFFKPQNHEGVNIPENLLRAAEDIPDESHEPMSAITMMTVNQEGIYLPENHPIVSEDVRGVSQEEISTAKMVTVEAEVHVQPSQSKEVSGLSQEEISTVMKMTVEAEVHAPPQQSKQVYELLPSPFKKSLIWPEEHPKTAGNKRKKEILPSVIAPEDYKSYLKKKMDKKAEQEEKKKARAAERAQKKAENDRMKAQKAMERDEKKTQKMKTNSRAKRAKKIQIETSSEEDDWQPEDEGSIEKSESEDDPDPDQLDEKQLENSTRMDSNSVAIEDKRLTTNVNSNAFFNEGEEIITEIIHLDHPQLVPPEEMTTNIEQKRREIIQSITEVLDDSTSKHENIIDSTFLIPKEPATKQQEGVVRESSFEVASDSTSENGDVTTAFLFANVKHNSKTPLSQETVSSCQEREQLLLAPKEDDQNIMTIGEKDYATVVLPGRKTRVVACQILKIGDKNAVARCLNHATE